MLKTRLITAFLLLPLLLWVMVLGPSWAMFLVILLAISISVYEMTMMLQPRLDDMLRNYVRFDPALASSREDSGLNYTSSARMNHYRRLAISCAFVMATLFSMTVYLSPENGKGLMVVTLILTMIAGVFATRGIEAEMARVLGFVLSLVYAGFPWLMVWDLYSGAPGARQLILVLAIVWMGDTGGYFGGRFFGKTKLAPHKSPKKTWEGAAAGLAASMAAALVTHLIYYHELPGGIPVALICGFFGGIAGQLGDLVESVFKRFTLVKDSGSLLPGHGGLLDRIDAVLFAAPVVWAILNWTQIGI